VVNVLKRVKLVTLCPYRWFTY